MFRPWLGLALVFLGPIACSGSAPTKGSYVVEGAAGGAPASTAEAGATSGESTDVAGAAGFLGSAGAGGVAGQAAAMGPIGPACDGAHACAKGLSCFDAQGVMLEGFGPAGGLCSMRCGTDVECTAIDPASRCVELFLGDAPSPKLCVPTCQLGDNHACGERDALACWPLQDANALAGILPRVCLPTCNYDDQCPDGTVCDLYYGLCSTWAPGGGLALGSPCDPAATSNACAEGFCIDLGAGGACTSYCRRGTFPQCGGMGESSICGWVFPGDEAAGAADIGMCANTCSVDANCALGSHCVLHADRTGMNKPGICTAG
ncbi:MAG TPA: hypothetical protein VIV60_26440 [Polyangiaceae bacterium]